MDKVDLGATRGTLLGTVSHLDLETGRPGRNQLLLLDRAC